jgi:hypothetical protein
MDAQVEQARLLKKGRQGKVQLTKDARKFILSSFATDSISHHIVIHHSRTLIVSAKLSPALRRIIGPIHDIAHLRSPRMAPPCKKRMI